MPLCVSQGLFREFQTMFKTKQNKTNKNREHWSGGEARPGSLNIST
jgi:hypothetical protein